MIRKIIFLIWFYINQWLLHLMLRLRGVIIAPSVIIKGSCNITKGVKIGSETLIQNSQLDGRGKLSIGSHCIINQATIITAQHNIDSSEYETTYYPVIIKDYAILYQESIILPGRNVGYGAIVAAGAVVAHDVPDMGVAAGNPARIIRYRKEVHRDCDVRAMGGAVFTKHLRSLFRKRFFRIFGEVKNGSS